MKAVDYLLTGATGFLGNVIQKRLTTGHSMILLGRAPKSGIIPCDLATTVPRLEGAFRTVIHVAGKAHVVPRSAQEEQRFFDVNVEGTLHLVQALEASIPQNFVFISTVAVYGLDSGWLIDESQPLAGVTPYAKSKIEAEKLLTQWCARRQVKLTILRLPLIVGKNPPGNLGSMLRWMQRGVYVGVGSGNARKSMVLAEDVADFIPRIESIGGTYNLTDGYHPSMSELELTMAKTLGKRFPLHLPAGLLYATARIGNLFGPNFPVTTAKVKKMEASLTFTDQRARSTGLWQPRQVLTTWQDLMQ